MFRLYYFVCSLCEWGKLFMLGGASICCMFLPARIVRVVPDRGGVGLRFPVYVRVDKIGVRVPGLGRIVFTRPPPPVVITPFTKVEIVEGCYIKVEELQHNVLLRVKYHGARGERYLIYPKSVWDKIWRNYLEPMHRGDPPKEPGLLLYGPKGTGKTSAIKLSADFLGLHVVDIDPSILSKYIGESESRLLQKLEEAELNEPSLVNMDEMDSLVRKRETYSGGDAGASVTFLNIIAILLRKLPEYKKEGRRILIILATNVSPSLIDDALLRHERFGSPVFVPPPDYEAIRTYLELNKIPEIIGQDETNLLAYRLSALGVSMADVVKIVEEIKETRRVPDLSSLSIIERGYRRPYPAKLPDIDPRIIKLVIDKFEPYTAEKSRLTILTGGLPYQICEAVLIVVLAWMNKPAVVLTDPRKFDEAIHTAEIVKGVLIVPADYMSSDIISYIYLNARVPVWFVATRQLPFPSPVKQIAELMAEKYLRVHGFVKTVLAFYGIEIDDRKLSKVSAETLKRVLLDLPFKKGTIEDILKEYGVRI